MGKYDKMYKIYQQCINNKFFFSKEYCQETFAFEETKKRLMLISSDEFLEKRDYFIYPDFHTVNMFLYKIKDLRGLKDECFITAISVLKHILKNSGKDCIKAKKIFIPRERKAQFDNVDIDGNFLLSDLDIDQNYVLFFEDYPQFLFIVKLEAKPSSEEKRWVLMGLCPSDANKMFFNTLYDDNGDKTLSLSSLLTNCEESLKDVQQETKIDQNLSDFLLSFTSDITKQVIKTLLFMKAVKIQAQNRSIEAERIREKQNLTQKRKDQLLKTAPQFLVYSLDKSSSKALSDKDNLSGIEKGNMRGHWVRGHFRKQRCGEKFKETKIIFIAPFFKGDSENIVEKIFKL